jgi:hypothetical protein
MRRAQLINGFGAVMTGVVLVTVLITKFVLGAWIAIAAMAGFYMLMLAIKRHYDHVAVELDATEVDTVLPSRNHAIVLVARLHRPTMRAISYARATRPDVLEAVTVNVDDADTRRLVREWDRRKIPVSLQVVESLREITKPVLTTSSGCARRTRATSSRCSSPSTSSGTGGSRCCTTRARCRIKTRLLFQPGVMVVSVPWQLKSSERIVERDELPWRCPPGLPDRPRDDRPAAPSPSSPDRRVVMGPTGRRRPGRPGRGPCRCRPAAAGRPAPPPPAHSDGGGQ